MKNMKTMYEDEFRKMDVDARVEFKVTGGRVKKRRFRLNQNDTPKSAMKKMEEQKKNQKKGATQRSGKKNEYRDRHASDSAESISG
jgi:hypothetical protein